MRRVMRAESNDAYWDRRWRETGQDADAFDDLSVYPIRYAEAVVQDGDARVLELGCGLGRVLKHYHRRGVSMTGVEKSAVAVAQLRREDASLDVHECDVRALPFADAQFNVVLAFGVYHNLEEGVDEALAETARCLKPGGRFCLSMRPDNLEMWLNEWYWRWRQRGTDRNAPLRFHKWFVTAREFTAMLATHGLDVDVVHHARNVSLLYRVPLLRARQRDETARRAEGYRLNALGRLIDGATTALMPGQRANALVFIGQKVQSPQRRRERRKEGLGKEGLVVLERDSERELVHT